MKTTQALKVVRSLLPYTTTREVEGNSYSGPIKTTESAPAHAQADLTPIFHRSLFSGAELCGSLSQLSKCHLDGVTSAKDICLAGADDFCLEAQAEFVEHIPSTDFESHISPPWAIWWASEFDHAADAPKVVDMLNEVRCRSLNELNMRDPPNFLSGVLYNVYIHHNEDDFFPDGWANGQGTNSYGMPFLTFPDGAHLDPSNVGHEGFHVFQYSSNAPGFVYADDSMWYIEATAQWYHAYATDGNDENGFIEIGSITRNPQITMWHSFDNGAPGDPKGWLYGVKQYGMHAWLWYLTGVKKVANNIIVEGFYGESQTLSPQEYLFNSIPNMREYFADWAVAATNNFDYLTREQYEMGELEVESLKPNIVDPNDENKFVLSLVDSGTGGTVRPTSALEPRGWAWNVIQVKTSSSAQYTFSFTGDSTGSDGAQGHFAGRVLLVSDDRNVQSNIKIDIATTNNNLEGSVTVNAQSDTTAIYFLVIAMPDFMEGYQTFGYQFEVRRLVA